MASFELTNRGNTPNDATEPLVVQPISKSSRNRKSLWMLLNIIFIGCIIVGTVFITKEVIENNDESNVLKKKPKNLIVIISDGMGQSYNTAYRLYKNLNKTIIDNHFKGRYSTTPTNKNGITDSAAGAVCFASGVQAQNTFIGIDGNGNPKGSILAAAKRQGKGTGIVVTKSVTDATPAAFTAHSLYRSWNEMISKQQAMRQINGAPMIDILYGGGRRYFERWGFFHNESMHKEYGWNKVIQDGDEFVKDLYNINITEMPYMALFCDGSCPYYLDRINGDIQINDSMDGITKYPDLMQMSTKAINLLSTKYEKEGFFLMIEASSVDLCGHDNDIVCALWEMEEFAETTEYVLDWAKNNGETLVVMLSDHETGGLSIGRDGSYVSYDVVRYRNGTMPRDWNVSGHWGSFDNDYSIAPPSSVSSIIEHYGAYKWIPDAISNCIHTADWFVDELRSTGSIKTVEQLYKALEDMYLGGINEEFATLSPLEKELIFGAFSRSSTTKRKAITAVMNSRTLTGWTTHGHSGADVAVYAYGPFEDRFIGHWYNYEIGQMLSDIFDVADEQQKETKYLQELFVNGELQICDPTNSVNYIEWNKSVDFPVGNLLYPDEKCVDEWI